MKLLAGMKCHPLLPLLLSAGVWAGPSPVSSPEADADNIYNINCAQFSGGICVNHGTSISGDTTNVWGGPANNPGPGPEVEEHLAEESREFEYEYSINFA